MHPWPHWGFNVCTQVAHRTQIKRLQAQWVKWTNRDSRCYFAPSSILLLFTLDISNSIYLDLLLCTPNLVWRLCGYIWKSFHQAKHFCLAAFSVTLDTFKWKQRSGTLSYCDAKCKLPYVSTGSKHNLLSGYKNTLRSELHHCDNLQHLMPISQAMTTATTVLYG